MVALIAVVRARAPRGAGSGYSFTIGCAAALAVLVLLWLLWLVVSSLRSDVPPEPAAPTVTIRAAPVLVATTQALPPPTPPPPTSTPPPPTPLVVVVVPPTPTPLVVVVVPPTPTPVVVGAPPTPTLALLPLRTPTPVPPPPPPPPTPTPARIGQPVESAGLVLTANAAARQTDVGPGTQPGAGQIFLVVEVTLESQRHDMPVPYAPTDFVVRDGTDAEHDALVPFGPDALRAGQLDPGRRATGRLVFEVPTVARGFVLRYQPAVDLPGFRPIWVLLGD
jgi:hypothetical protein